MRQKVLEVREVEIAVLADGRLEVRARGTVPSLGWSAPELVPYSTIAPARDGIYDVDFIAEAPDRGSPSVIDVLIAEVCLALPKGAKGIRVHASVSSMVGIVAEAKKRADGSAEVER